MALFLLQRYLMELTEKAIVFPFMFDRLIYPELTILLGVTPCILQWRRIGPKD
jgi:hypothetical protein